MIFQVVIVQNGVSKTLPREFANVLLAYEARETVYATLSALDQYVDRIHVQRKLPALYGWMPDHADLTVLGSIAAQHKIVAIKFVRSKSGSGLKEAKDWIEENFPKPTDEPVIAGNTCSLGELLHRKLKAGY